MATGPPVACAEIRMRTIFLLSVLLPVLLRAEKIEVCQNCPVSNVAGAISVSSEQDTILIKEGKYEAVNLEIRHPLTIIGEGKVVLDGLQKGYILKIGSDGVSLGGLTLINAGKSYTRDYAAIYGHGIQDFVIEGNEIVNPFFGILIEKSSNGQISNNLIRGNAAKEDDGGNGIHLLQCDSMLVSGNEVHGMRDGIYFEFVDHSVVSDNYSHDNIRYGLHYMFSNHDEYHSNTFENNGSGVAVMFSKFILMKENRFINNWGTASYGLLLKEIYDAEVEDNLFNENTIAVFTEGSTRVNYSGNTFLRNGWAVKVSGGCYTNHFTGNNFMGNAFDVSYNSKMNDNLFAGNYWDSYSGYDLDKNGEGDVPHRPVKLFSYVVNETPETIVLLRSLFVDIINFSERVSPVFTPDDLVDDTPSIRQLQ